MTVDGYTIREATERDVDGFLELHRTVFGTWPDDVAHEIFDWKYRANPFVDGLPVIVAVRDGTVVGAKGHFCLELAVDNASIRGVQTGDLMVHPEHRRQGLLSAMVELDTALYDEGEQLFFGVPSEAAIEGYLAAGRRLVQNPLYVRPLANGPTGDGSRGTRALQAAGVAAFRAYAATVDRLVPTDADVVVERTEDQPVELLERLYRRRVPDGIHAPRSAALYRWRFGDPLGEYATYLARDGTKVIAGVVVSERDGAVFLRDVVPLDVDAGALRAIIDAVVTEYSDREYLASWCPASFDHRTLLRAGLVPSTVIPRFPYATDLVVRRVGESWTVRDTRVDDPESWDIQLLERDY